MATVEQLLDEITVLSQCGRDIGRIEHTLTDGYAHALALEAEHRRIETRIAEATRALERGNPVRLAHELQELTRRLDAIAGELNRLRDSLADLRHRATTVRLGS